MSRYEWKNGTRITKSSEEEEMKFAKDAVEERKRPLTESEINRMLIAEQINTLAVDDQTALRMTMYYPEWKVGMKLPTEQNGQPFKVQYKYKLYKVTTAHTAQADWSPDVAVTMFTRIDEMHDGSKYDPIPYDGNMALSAELYYVQDGTTYLCNRDTVNPVYNPLQELVGLYVKKV